MNNDLDNNDLAGTEARVIAALRSLADSHTPTHHSVETTRPNSHRRTLLAAAAAVLVVGAGALLVAADRDSGGMSDRLPQVDVSTPTTTTTETTLPATASLPAAVVYSPTPLDDDMVPVLVPPPVEPVFGYEFSSSSQWVSGTEGQTWFAVLDNDQVIGSVAVFDSAAPWSTIAEGQEVVDLDGVQAIRMETEGQRGIVIKFGDATRFALDKSPATNPLSIDNDIAALLALIGDGSPAQFDDTARFVRPRVEGPGHRGVSYGDDPAIDLVQVRLEHDAPEGTVGLIKQLYAMSYDPGSPDRLTEVVRVSPVDLVIIGANEPEELSSALQSLRMVTVDESGIDFRSFGWNSVYTVITRGEPAWGRWQVSADPDDPSCETFSVYVWSVVDNARGFNDCSERNPVRADGGRVYCARLDLEIVAVVLGAQGPPEFALGDDIDGLKVERFESNGAVTVRVLQDDPGANIRAATITVDGVKVNCN